MNKHPEIEKLSKHLHASLCALSGRILGPAPRFRLPLLVPVAVIVAATVLLSVSQKARSSLLLKLTMLVSTRLLQVQTEKEVTGDDQGKE